MKLEGGSEVGRRSDYSSRPYDYPNCISITTGQLPIIVGAWHVHQMKLGV